MTWQNTSLIMLRTMLNDAGCSTVKYTPQRLDDLLITSAYFLPIEINFNSSFVVNVETRTVTPDPGLTTTTDEGNFRTAALSQGVMARCGPAVLQTSSYGQYLGTLLNEGPCKSYEELKKRYNFSYNGGKILRAVMSPFASNSFDPTNMLGSMGEADLQNPIRRRGQYF